MKIEEDEMNFKESVAEKPVQGKKVPPPSFVKLAMRNMVKKGSQSLRHLGYTAFGFVGFILLIAWIGRPNLPQ